MMSPLRFSAIYPSFICHIGSMVSSFLPEGHRDFLPATSTEYSVT
ncbi:MAG: hypothetical protein PHV54_04265 [Tolumonas sp.]|nr:hypothetical protein [uncultured Tolumonas sp.]MDD2342085.1 hypothetical protein [Tolumonas sp.]